jgi:hypothetical protein
MTDMTQSEPLKLHLLFTPHEDRAVRYLAKRCGEEVPVEAIAGAIYLSKTERPRSWRATTMTMMRVLQIKCAFVGPIQFCRKSRLGAGGKATYLATQKEETND